MNKLSASVTNTFNLLSIGQRGVGKTVFLAGSYAELHPTHQINSPQNLWFDCRESQDEERIDRILSYVAQSGQYPPPTMRITNFNFSLKSSSLWGNKTLCHFRWWDVPGESSNTGNSDFQKIVLGSHGCCVFINAEALVNDRSYLQPLEEMISQVVAIASLVNQHRLKYAFAFVFTKCDLLEPGPMSLLQIEEKIQPLLARLNTVKANYQKFYSAIPIVSFAGVTALKATGAAAPLLWLITELRKLNYFQAGQDLGSGLKQSITNPTGRVTTAKNLLGLNLLLNPRSYSLVLSIAAVGLVGAIAALLTSPHLSRSLQPPFSPLSGGAGGWGKEGGAAPKQSQPAEQEIREYEQILSSQPDNVDALLKLANLWIDKEQPDRAIPLMEKLVQQQPNSLDLQLNLAQVYKSAGQKQKAETAYDQILSKEKDNLAALVSKAVIRSEQGDDKTAKVLFVQAEQAAPGSLKTKIRAIADHTLQSPAQASPVAK